jgi:hypothetical protein
MGILIGYSNVGYRVLLNGRVIIARHVEFVEENVKCIGLDSEGPENEDDMSKSRYENNECEESSDDDSMDKTFESTNEHRDERLNENVRRSDRAKNVPKKLNEYYVYNGTIFANMCSINVPDTFEEAIKSNESDHWKKAMDKEIDCLDKNNTWELVENVNKISIRCEMGLYKKV